jgi:hypothetical protein
LKEFTFDASICRSKRKWQLYNTVNVSRSLIRVNTQHARKEHEMCTKLVIKHEWEEDHLKDLHLHLHLHACACRKSRPCQKTAEYETCQDNII